MDGRATEFFGMDFGTKQDAPVQNTAQEAPKPSQGGFVQSALQFFGIDFSTPKTVPDKPREVAPSKFDQVFNRLISAESRGDNNAVSEKGARGITQVMPATAGDPGFGVQPLRNTSEAEYKRFGKDYLQAMLKEFGGDYEKALAAYNAGVGNVKAAIDKGGNNWKKHLPKPSETLPYIDKILGVRKDNKKGEGGDPNMTSDDKYIQNLFTKAKENPEFKEMYDFLGSDMPVVKARYLGQSTSGEFATNVDSSGPLHKNGEISMGYGSFNYQDHSTNDNGMNTFVHETAHATDRKIRLLADQLESKKDLTPTQKQFLDTYQKIGKFDWKIGELNDNRMGGQSVISNVVKAIAPQWFGKENNYRSSARELVGFGVGNSSVPKGKGDDKSPPHVDPTVASMFFILLDQAKKVQKELKK